MNKICDLHSMPKGAVCEIQGEITYENPPKATRYGKGLNQFIVVNDNIEEGGVNGIGVNVSVASVEDGFIKGNKVTVKGKVDKYPDRNQPLQPDGTFPMKTSVKADHIEHYVDADDFPDPPITGHVPNVMDKEDLVQASKPAPTNGYSTAKGVEEEKKRIMWEKKELKICKQAVLKVVGRLVEAGTLNMKVFFRWADKLVDYVYNEDDKFALITEANLMQSGLITVTKAEALDWIETHVKGTDVEQDLCGILHVKALDKQTLNELLETVEKLSLAI